jgi:hypothetical protein
MRDFQDVPHKPAHRLQVGDRVDLHGSKLVVRSVTDSGAATVLVEFESLRGGALSQMELERGARIALFWSGV